MRLKPVLYVVVFVEIIYVHSQVSKDMVEKGQQQYQLLQQRSNLPQYGNCWKSAIEHVEEGCNNLSEETQSDVALHITNCFLEMSGLDTYNCQSDRKRNVRGICIRSMTDRAFNVYTEFYTHTQNICWFLRAQIWHETIAENSLRVGKQLQLSLKQQEYIIESQKESLALQEKLMVYGQNLEKIMEDFYISTQQHQEILSIMSNNLKYMQSWLVNEVSWVDLIVFYTTSSILIFIFTSTNRTAAARLPTWFLLLINAIIERLISVSVTANVSEKEIYMMQNDLYKYIWWLRKCFGVVALFIVFYSAYCYKDLTQLNNSLLQIILKQNLCICEHLEKLCDYNIHYASTNRNEGDLLDNVKLNNSFNQLHKNIISTKNDSDVQSSILEFNHALHKRKAFSSSKPSPTQYNLRSKRT